MNTLFLYAVGVLILYKAFQFLRKKKPKSTLEALQKGTEIQTELSDFPAQPKNYVEIMTENTQQQVFDWFKSLENISRTAYPDPPGFAIGLGHFIKPDEGYLLTAKLTDAQILELFNKDIKWVLDAIKKNVKVPLNKNQKLALMSITYNIGAGGLQKSDLLRKLNERNYALASGLILTTRVTSQGRFNQGILNRRRKEKALFDKPV